MTYPLYTRAQAKAYARTLRTHHAEAGTPISHAKALELTASDQGFESWNHLCARLSNEPMRTFQVGDRIEGSYLKQAVTGSIIAVRQIAGGEAFEITVTFDEAVDVVEFESFSNLRKRVSAIVSRDGVSLQKISGGVPVLVVAPVETELV